MFINSVTNFAPVGTATATARQTARPATTSTVAQTSPTQGVKTGRRRSAPVPRTRVTRASAAKSKVTRARRASATPRATKRKSEAAQDAEPSKRLRSAKNAVLDPPMTTAPEVSPEVEVVDEALGSAEASGSVEEHVEKEDPKDGDFEPDTPSVSLSAPALAPQIVKKQHLARTLRVKKNNNPMLSVGDIDSTTSSGSAAASPVTARRPAAARRPGPVVAPAAIRRPEPEGNPLVWAEVLSILIYSRNRS